MCMRVCVCTFYIFIVVDYFIESDTAVYHACLLMRYFVHMGFRTYVKHTQQTCMCIHTQETRLSL